MGFYIASKSHWVDVYIEWTIAHLLDNRATYGHLHELDEPIQMNDFARTDRWKQLGHTILEIQHIQQTHSADPVCSP